MLHAISERIADFIISDNDDQKDERDVLIYGTEVLLSDIINFLVVILTGLLFGHVLCSLVFFVSFAALRKRTGGYHANTHLRCNIVLLINTVLVMLLIMWLSLQKNIIVIVTAAAVFCGISLWLIAPVDNVNKKLDDNSKYRLKKQSMIVWSIMSVMVVILTMFGCFEYSIAISSGMMSTVVALFVSLIQDL
jgi:accessory gene regulator B